MEPRFPYLTLPTSWQNKVRQIHHGPWQGDLEEAGTGSCLQFLLQTEAGASQTLRAAHTHYARDAQAQAYPNAPATRVVSQETVQHWASHLFSASPGSEYRFALALSAVSQTHTWLPGSDAHGWLSLQTTHHQYTVHFRCKTSDRQSQHMSCGLLGIELLYLLTQNQLSPESLDPQLKDLLEIDVWHSSQGDHLLQHLHLLSLGWSPIIYLHQGQAKRYLSALRGQHLLVAKGSFNPLTKAHMALLKTAHQQAQSRQATPVLPLFELALHNADKGQSAIESLWHRLCMLARQDYPVMLTQTPTLLATKVLCLEAQAQQVDFVCGTDLYERVLLPRYYHHSGGLDRALAAIFAHNTQLWVGSRSPETYPALSDPLSETRIEPYLEQVHPFALKIPVSASAVRASVAQFPHLKSPWEHWVSEKIAQYIVEQGLYQSDSPI